MSPPPASPPPAAWQRRSRRLTLAALGIVAAMALLAGQAILAARDGAWREARAEADRSGLALRFEVGRTLRASATALQAISHEFGARALLPLDAAERQALLTAVAPRGAAYSDTMILDPTGAILFHMGGRAPSSRLRADREYFAFHRDNPAPGWHVSAPMRSISDGRWITALSQRLTTPEGDFAGVVASVIEIEHLRGLFAGMRIGPHGSIVLLRTDGTILMRAPFTDAALGVSLAGTPIFDAWQRGSQEPLIARSAVDGEERLVLPFDLPAFPVLLMVNIASQDVLAAWRPAALRIAGITAALSLALLGVVGLFRREIAQRAAAERAVAEQAALFGLIAGNSPDMVSIIGPDGRRSFVSAASRHLLGLPPEALIGQAATALAVPEDQPGFAAAIERAMRGGGPVAACYRTLTAEGETRWLECTLRVAEGTRAAGQPSLVAVARDVTQAKLREAALTVRAERDGLTGLLNRGACDAALAALLEAGQPVAVLAIDLDRFKTVNDRAGHAAGDAVLQATAERLRAVLRDRDVVGRPGGDEFLVLLADRAALDRVEEIAVRVRAALREPVPWQGRTLRVGVTIGIAWAPEDATDAPGLLAAADAALMRGKRIGRGRICRAARAVPVTPELG